MRKLSKFLSIQALIFLSSALSQGVLGDVMLDPNQAPHQKGLSVRQKLTIVERFERWQRILEADRDAANGEWKSAAKEVREILRKQAESYEILIKAAMLHGFAEDSIDAERYWERVMEMVPVHGFASLVRADMDIRAGKVDKARPLLEAAYSNRADSLIVRMVTAGQLIEKRDDAGAGKAMGYLELPEVAFALRWLASNEDWLGRLVSKDTEKRLRRLVLTGTIRYREPVDLDTASLLTCAAKLEQAWRYMAQCEGGPAVRQLREAFELGAIHPEVLSYTGLGLAYAGLHGKAEEVFRDVEEEFPGIPEVHYQWMRARLEAGQYDKVLKQLDALPAEVRSQADFLLLEAFALFHAGQETASLQLLTGLKKANGTAALVRYTTGSRPYMRSLVNTAGFKQLVLEDPVQ